jgi:AraC-like DNA-binding protein
MNEMILPHLIEANTPHTPSFVFSREKPRPGFYLVMLFRTAARIRTVHGIEDANPGDMIVNSPDFPLWHCSKENALEGFRNDWFFVAAEAIEPEIHKQDFPLNVLVPTGSIHLLEPFIIEIKMHIMRHDEWTAHAIALNIGLIFITATRARLVHQLLRRKLDGREKEHYPRFTHIREWLQNNPSIPYDSEKLARTCNLSAGRFVFLYRAFFGKTPFAELMDARNILARRLLFRSEKSIAAIAEACGWKDPRYFNRIFRKFNGMSPSDFRRARDGEIV